MSRANNNKSFGAYSRLNWLNIIVDDGNDVRFGMRDSSFMTKLKNTAEYKPWRIKPKYEYRPMLISNYFYGTPEFWWIVFGFNEFFHPMKDFYVDRLIKIPDQNNIIGLLL